MIKIKVSLLSVLLQGDTGEYSVLCDNTEEMESAINQMIGQTVEALANGAEGVIGELLYTDNVFLESSADAIQIMSLHGDKNRSTFVLLCYKRSTDGGPDKSLGCTLIANGQVLGEIKVTNVKTHPGRKEGTVIADGERYVPNTGQT